MRSDKDNELFFFLFWIQGNPVLSTTDVSPIIWPDFLHFNSHSLCSLSASSWLKNFSGRLSLFNAWVQVLSHLKRSPLFRWPNRLWSLHILKQQLITFLFIFLFVPRVLRTASQINMQHVYLLHLFQAVRFTALLWENMKKHHNIKKEVNKNHFQRGFYHKSEKVWY